MRLHAAISGSGPPVVLMHGLFGMGSNLGGLARHLAATFEVHQLDLPNHGRSDWVEHMDLQSMADAVAQYCRDKLPAAPVVIGHSLGGKVAMQLALSGSCEVAAIGAADIAPVTYAGSHDAVFAAIETVVAAEPGSRAEASALMGEHVEEEGVIQFLALSLQRSSNGSYRWRFNAEALRANYPNLLRAPDPGVFEGPALFVSGSASPYVTPEGIEVARAFFPNARFSVLEGAGHWLHVQKPDEFNTVVLEFARDALSHRRPETGAGAA